MIKFTNLTGAEEIGSNSYLLEIDGTRVVLDAGMHPKREGHAAKPQYSLIGEKAPDAIFVTHSHLDHIGTLPVLQELYPSSPVYMTNGTAVLAEAMLHNSVNVMTSKRTSEGIVEYPFFTHGDLDRIVDGWTERSYNEAFRIGKHGEVMSVLYDAGHILGSCGVYLESPSGHSVLYTGDIQLEDQSMIPGADLPADGVDTLIIECTRGSAERAVHYTREKELERLASAISETLAANGAVLIPVFALGKSQELLYNIQKFKEEGKIPDVPVYFGGLGSKVTGIYDKLSDVTPRMNPGYRLKEVVETLPLPRQGKAPLRVSPGNIYLVSSGMMNEKTPSNSLAEQVLPKSNNAILFVGYCDPDSPAGALKATPPGELVKLREKGGQAVPRNCRVESFDFSGHAPREALVEYIHLLHPKRVVLVHGDPEAIEWMRDEVQRILPGMEIVIPEPGATYDLMD
ncbi:MBL fold metallo-hydrolase [Akkermansia glycaniphila]|uniref:Metallo-beta-lactamase n=1 Tax=Akkermansia glycaniphila TaxID=1679444 RepID=A0A1H6KQ25_9BACT|nr:MBL fold metallo-hydrolase [Akkermansia glycaniphila]MBT9449951.1 MBL fold metallo-hydrolase [Akkermansia glycaniphila]SEH77880.1 metallo-beta-lactamase [Akkermansia glycaniphila]